MYLKRFLISILATLASALAWAQSPPDSASIVTVKASAPIIASGATDDATVTLRVLTGWHINSDKPALDYLRPTAVTLEAGSGVSIGSPRYPRPQMLRLSFSDEPLSVFEGTTAVSVPLTVAAGTSSGKVTLRGQVAFQPCNATSCFSPATKPFTLVVRIGAAAAQSSAATSPAPAVPGAAQGDPWSDALRTRGLAVFLALLFMAGLALNLTPCVYPMIAVTMSIFGARAGEARGRVLGKAVLYVLGMATMYTTLGLVAALTGSLFGGALQSLWVQVGIALFLAVLALGMFGAYELQPPPRLAAALGGANRTGNVGIFLSGLVVGVFAAPCVGPVVLGLLAMVGARHDIGFGALSFFVLALGLGAPYVVLALFAGLMGKLPKSGGWMESVKHVFGIVLLGVAARYLALALMPAYAGLVAPVTLVLGGLFMAAADRPAGEGARFRRNKRLAAILVAAAGAYIGAGVWTDVDGRRAGDAARWPVYSDAAFAAARAAGQPVVLDFGASWCAACQELEHRTFSDPAVIDALQPFARFRVELDGANRSQEAELRKRWGVKGLPDVIFLDASGAPVPAARVGGYLPPGEFLKKVAVVRGGE